jgi:hypothetical protein
VSGKVRTVAHPLLRRELRLLARDAGLGVALVGFLSMMLAAGVLLLVRELGAPPTQQPAGDSLLSSLVGLQWALAGLVAPWALTRLDGNENADGVVRWAVQCAVHPWQMTGARLITAWVYLLHLLLLPLPLLLIVRSVTEAGPAALLGAYFGLGCWLLLLAPAVLLCQPAARGVLGRLGLSYLAASFLALARHFLAGGVEGAMVNAVMLVAAGGLALLLLAGSRHRLLYLGA